MRDIVDASSKRDIRDARAFESNLHSCYIFDLILYIKAFVIPKLYIKLHYCVSCAIHARIVRVRSGDDKRIRRPPLRIRVISIIDIYIYMFLLFPNI